MSMSNMFYPFTCRTDHGAVMYIKDLSMFLLMNPHTKRYKAKISKNRYCIVSLIIGHELYSFMPW